jgi:hypothetical protein
MKTGLAGNYLGAFESPREGARVDVGDRCSYEGAACGGRLEPALIREGKV